MKDQLKRLKLASLNVPAVDASALYAEVCTLQKSFELPWQNLLAMLMDSISVMRDHKLEDLKPEFVKKSLLTWLTLMTMLVIMYTILLKRFAVILRTM